MCPTRLICVKHWWPSAPGLVSMCLSAPVAAVSWVSAAAMVFALVAAIPVPFVGPRPLPPVAMSASPLMFVFLWREIKRAVSLSVPFPLSVSVRFDWSVGTRPGALPLVTRTTAPAVAVTPAEFGVAVAVVTGLRLEMREKGWGRVSMRQRAATVRARAWPRAVRPWATASAVVTGSIKTYKNLSTVKLLIRYNKHNLHVWTWTRMVVKTKIKLTVCDEREIWTVIVFLNENDFHSYWSCRSLPPSSACRANRLISKSKNISLNEVNIEILTPLA